MNEIYLPGFKAGIDAGAMSVMTSLTKLMESGLGKVRMLLRIFLEKNWDLNGW